MSEAVDEYFDQVRRAKTAPTLQDLAQHLGFPDEHGFDDAEGTEFEEAAAMAKQRIEANLVRRLLDGRGDAHAIMTRLVTDHGRCWPEGFEGDPSSNDADVGEALEAWR